MVKKKKEDLKKISKKELDELLKKMLDTKAPPKKQKKKT